MNTDIKLRTSSPETPATPSKGLDQDKTELIEKKEESSDIKISKPASAEISEGAQDIAITKEVKSTEEVEANIPAESSEPIQEASTTEKSDLEGGDENQSEKTEANIEQPEQPERQEEHKLSSNVVDLRTPESEEAKRKAQEEKDNALEDQKRNSAVIAANNIGDVKMPATSQPSTFELPDEEFNKPNNTEVAQSSASAAAPQVEKEVKKPGFFARLFGKK